MKPWDEIYTAARKLRDMAAAAREEMRANPYWGTQPTAFEDGINNACGGPAGELAAVFNPDMAVRFAARLDAVGDAWPRHDPHTTTALAVESRRDILLLARSVNATTGGTSASQNFTPPVHATAPTSRITGSGPCGIESTDITTGDPS